MNRILILDIDSCAECPCIHQYEGGAWCVAKDTPMPINWMIFDEIPKDGCPLRPLPKGHGRLIDADSELKSLREMKVFGEVFKTAVNFAILVIENAPTITEADEGKQNERE